ncbi:zinc-ribbon domain-containing protein [Paraburkholderia fungorum]|uniref:Zinc-ribbon domain-containing protein n=1 Tax=Paraburkholderia fungorum TaxID=134537 RepID=A0A1H1IHR7_9BURK|nr:zinc-ribbon domain-containing protein [Paraburkholderia fungorum]SDR37305.1 zinc-ribbon domain-containing protein [Paraburkholderia fungorum]
MALFKCRECGTEISNKSKACVKCGAPVKKTSKPAELVAGIVVVGLMLWVASSLMSSGKGDAPKAAESPTPVAAEKCNADDLQCLGDKGVVAAGVYCQDDIERLAKHSVKWTDGTFETKFSRFRWSNKKDGIITYVGDKAEFQNGFGAYTPVIYECDLGQDNKTVLDVRVREGRLSK